MSFSNKVVWSEGMFLRPQHFQQQDRYIEQYVQRRVNALSAYYWGFQTLTLDQELLRLGKISILTARGVFPDGTPFSVPGSEPSPPVLEVAENAKNQVIYLCIPQRRVGRSETLDAVTLCDSPNNDPQAANERQAVEQGAETYSESRYNTETVDSARYQSFHYDTYDTTTDVSDTASIQIGKLRLRLVAGIENLTGYSALSVVKIRERSTPGRIELDSDFIPPLLDCRESAVIRAYLESLQLLLKHKGDTLVEGVLEAEREGGGDIADYLLLQAINRFEPLLVHLTHTQSLHPMTLYMAMLGFAGEVSTFSSQHRRVHHYPLYQHDNLSDSFGHIFSELHRFLYASTQKEAILLKVVERKYSIYLASIADSSLLNDAIFILAIKSPHDPERVSNSYFLNQAKVSPMENLRELVKSDGSNIKMRKISSAPAQIPCHVGYRYFELERSHPIWQQLKLSAGLALYFGAEYSGLQMELWVIKN